METSQDALHYNTESCLPSTGPVFHDRGNSCYQAGLCSQTLPTNDAWESVRTPLRRLPDAPVKHQCQMWNKPACCASVCYEML